MHKHVEQLIGRLATDPGLRERFATQPFEVLSELRLELTEVEIAALVATDPAAIRAFAATLDARLRKSPPARETRGADGPNPMASPDAQPKETLR